MQPETDEPVEMTTYRQADGWLVMGEYAFVTDTDYFDDVDEPLDVIKEVWVRQSVETVTFKPVTFKPTGWDELLAENELEGQEDTA